jgi:hypothetical protein
MMCILLLWAIGQEMLVRDIRALPFRRILLFLKETLWQKELYLQLEEQTIRELQVLLRILRNYLMLNLLQPEHRGLNHSDMASPVVALEDLGR